MTDRGTARFIPALDGLRGIAILVVIIHHATLYRPSAGVDLLVGNLLFFGWAGVDLFFVLSGFLITGILIDTRDSARYFTTFYARRILRIFPLYYLVLFVAFTVVPMFPALLLVFSGADTAPPQLAYWLYVSNFSIAERGWLYAWIDVSWSLAIEEQFYLVWPLIVWLSPRRVVAALCVIILIAEPAIRIVQRSDAEFVLALPIYVQTWYRLDGLAMGALLALAERRGLFPRLDRSVPVVIGATLAGLVACSILGGHTWWWNRRMQQYGYSLIAVLGGAMLVSAVSRPASSLWSRMLSAGWLRAFGKYSYGLYLLHPPVMLAIQEYVFDPEEFETTIAPWVAQIGFYGLVLPASFAVAWLSWRFFEAPILRLKARLPY